MKQVDLVKILKSKETYDEEYPTISVSDALEAMREACNQTVDLCAENATLNELRNGEWVASYIIYNTPQGKIEVNEQSILDTKKQII